MRVFAYYILKGVLIGLCIRIKIGDPIGAVGRQCLCGVSGAARGAGHSLLGVL